MPVDAIAHILSYVNMSHKFNQSPMYRCTLPQLRGLSRTFNTAIKSFRPLWLEFLGDKGPLRIGPKSVHRTDWEINRGKCKYNKRGRCHIAAHYDRDTLEARYNTDDPYKAYDTVMELRKPKGIKRVKALMGANRRALERLTKKYKAAKRKREDDYKELEQKLKRYTE